MRLLSRLMFQVDPLTAVLALAADVADVVF